MKKTLILAAAATLAVPALAEITISGDARWRVTEVDQTGANSEAVSNRNGRLRLHVDGQNAEGNVGASMVLVSDYGVVDGTDQVEDDITQYTHVWVKLSDNVMVKAGQFNAQFGSMAQAYADASDDATYATGTLDTDPVQNGLQLSFDNEQFAAYVRSAAEVAQPTTPEGRSSEYLAYGASLNYNNFHFALDARPDLDDVLFASATTTATANLTAGEILTWSGFTNLYFKADLAVASIELERFASSFDDIGYVLFRVVAPNISNSGWGVKFATVGGSDLATGYAADVTPLGENYGDWINSEGNGLSASVAHTVTLNANGGVVGDPVAGLTSPATKDYLGVAVTGSLAALDLQLSFARLEDYATDTTNFVEAAATYSLGSNSAAKLVLGSHDSNSFAGFRIDTSF